MIHFLELLIAMPSFLEQDILGEICFDLWSTLSFNCILSGLSLFTRLGCRFKCRALFSDLLLTFVSPAISFLQCFVLHTHGQPPEPREPQARRGISGTSSESGHCSPAPFMAVGRVSISTSYTIHRTSLTQVPRTSANRGGGMKTYFG